ncbi:MAG: hypothetical protein IJD14_02320, partial [Christensenellaceae bacterium]|nr:hypothetical protein [Christensenellaceae bacterium]
APGDCIAFGDGFDTFREECIGKVMRGELGLFRGEVCKDDSIINVRIDDFQLTQGASDHCIESAVIPNVKAIDIMIFDQINERSAQFGFY